jgi:asparagine synthase (glutamine-hydrolysing)
MNARAQGEQIMPGIVAIIGDEVSESLVRNMIDSITHEYWQRNDIYIQPPIAIGRVHLGIVNPEPQPIFNEEKSAFIVMDGEIYDYEKEKKRLESKGHVFRVNNDAEFCLHLYEDRGESFVDNLEGSFVLVIYDIENERIIVANDKHGLRHLYFTKNDDRYILSSEVKAILEDETFEKEIDHEAVADFFAFGRILGYKTLFKRIKELPPGSMMVWFQGKLSERKYWNFKFEENANATLDHDFYVDTLVNLFRNAARKRTRGKFRFGIFLSGGLDSRTVAAAVKSESQELNSLTYGTKGSDETNIAKEVANALGAEHHFVELRRDFLAEYAEKAIYYTDGMMLCAHIWLMNLLPKIREDVDVVFHGTSLDILLGTYLSRVAGGSSIERVSRIFLEREVSKASSEVFLNLLFSVLNNPISSKIAPFFYSQNYYQKVKDYPFRSLKQSFERSRGTDPTSRTDYFFLESLARLHLSLVMVRNYVEDRFLGFDKDFFSFGLTIPTKLRFGYKLYYHFLTRLAPEVARLPYQRTGVPPQWPMVAHTIGFLIKGGYRLLTIKLGEKTKGLINLPRIVGYPDLDQLIRSDPRTRRFFEDIILDQKTLSRGYFNSDFVIKMVNEHMTNKRNWGQQLCALLTFELWNRYFVD